MGPSAIRYAGLADRLEELGRDVIDHGNVPADIAEATDEGDEHARFLRQILRTCERIAGVVREAREAGCFPLVLGGDHSVALGSLGGLASVHGRGGVIWIDAHGDLNRPETSPSGNVHGMVLAAALGFAGAEFETEAWPSPAVDHTRVALSATRQLDDGERRLIRERGIRVWTMSTIDQLGMERTVREALAHAIGPFQRFPRADQHRRPHALRLAYRVQARVDPVRAVDVSAPRRPEQLGRALADAAVGVG